MKLLKLAADFIIDSHIWLGIAAFGLCVETYCLHNKDLTINVFCFFIFFSTTIIFRIFRRLIVTKDFVSKNGFKKFLTSNRSLLIDKIVLFCFAGIVSTLPLLNLKTIIYLLPHLALALAYIFPIIYYRRKLFNLRETFLKIFVITLIWSSITVVLPLVFVEQTMDKSAVLVFMERFLFVFALVMSFDIHDAKEDADKGLKTIPVIAGVHKARHIALFSVVLFLLTIIYHYLINEYQLTLFIALFVSSIVLGTLIYYTAVIKNNKYYYWGLIDGTMILQGVLVISSYNKLLSAK